MYLGSYRNLWQQSKLGNTEFINIFRPFLVKTSFASYFDIDFFKNDTEIKQALGVLSAYLNIKTIKLVLCWDKIELKDQTIGLDKYINIINIAGKLGLNIYLELAITKKPKSQDCIPEFIKQDLAKADLLPKNKIEPESTLAIRAFDYLERLCFEIRNKVDPKALEKINLIQIENLPFSKLNSNDLVSTQEYIQEAAHLICEYFKDINIGITSYGLDNLDQIIQTIELLPYNLTIGVDTKNPYKSDSKNIFSWLKKFTVKPTTPEDLKMLSKKYVFDINISCFDMGYFLNQSKEYSLDTQFKFMLLGSQQMLDLSKDTSIITLYGLEELIIKLLSQKETDQESVVIDLIQKIQTTNMAMYLSSSK